MQANWTHFRGSNLNGISEVINPAIKWNVSLNIAWTVRIEDRGLKCIDELVPGNILGDGMRKFLSIIATIARSANLKLMRGCILEATLALGCSVQIVAGLGTFNFIDLDPHIAPGGEPFIGGLESKSTFHTISNIQGGIGVQENDAGK